MSSTSLSSLMPLEHTIGMSTAVLFTMTSASSALPAAFLATPRPRRQQPLFNEPKISQLFHHEMTASHDDDMENDILASKSLRTTLNLSSSSNKWNNGIPDYRPMIVGHRGCLYDELENTREGFRKTAEMGADAVELDVFLLKCGTLVVFHGSGSDENPGLLQGYCQAAVDGAASILDYSYEECLQLVFNHNYKEFGCPPNKIHGATIPTLEQVLLDLKETRIIVKIELKGQGTAEPVLELVDRLEMQHQCHYSSFDLTQIATVRRLKPHQENGQHVYKTGALFNDVFQVPNYIQLAQQVGATEVHLRYDECTVNRVEEIHNAGMDSMAWFRGPVGMWSDCFEKFLDVGNEDASMYEVMMQTGVRQMCVNRPNILVNMFEREPLEQ